MRFSVILAAALMLASCGGERSAGEKQSSAPAAPTVKITQFYPNQPAIPKGEAALLCYGVEGAAKVRIDPPVEQLSPALTRCIEVKPETTTKYTLTAEARDGSTVSQTTTVQVGGARPKLVDLQINKKEVKAGEEVRFCFQARNATSVKGSPGKFLRGGVADKDCLIDNPSKTTTYTITISNANQLTDSASTTVEVRP